MCLTVCSGILLNWGVWSGLFSWCLSDIWCMVKRKLWHYWKKIPNLRFVALFGMWAGPAGPPMVWMALWRWWLQMSVFHTSCNCHKESRCSSEWCRLYPSPVLFFLMKSRDYDVLSSPDNSSSILWFIFSDIIVPKRGFLSLPVQHTSTPTQPPKIHSYLPAHNIVSKAAMLQLKKGWHSCPRLVRWHCTVRIGGVITAIFRCIGQSRLCFLWNGRLCDGGKLESVADSQRDRDTRGDCTTGWAESLFCKSQ